MLVAALDRERIEADVAERGLAYVCSKCRRPVILKRGRIKIAHFAHKPPTDCMWASGETLAHLGAKKLFRDAFRSRGLRAELEVVIPSLPNDRRADVMIWSPSNLRVAIELQHSSIGIEAIEKRAYSYAREGIAQAWVPFLRESLWKRAERRRGGHDGNIFVDKYPARPFERWAHGFHSGHLWFYDPRNTVLWCGHFDDHEIWVEESSWYDDGGDERHAGGFYRVSKRWKRLTLWGPYSLGQVKVKIVRRREWHTDRYNMPSGRVARFVIDNEPD